MRLERTEANHYAILTGSEVLIGYCEDLDALEYNAKINLFGKELKKVRDMIDQRRRKEGKIAA